jgi:hypothetical protein
MVAMSLMSEATLRADCLENVPFDKLHKLLDSRTYARVTGLFSPEEILDARERVRRRFDVKNDRKHDPKDAEAIRRNFQKLIVGGTKGANGVPRFLRMFYNPTFDEDIFGMHAIFRRLIHFRNLLYSLPKDFTCNGTDNGMWTASRINHYPRGGGFMAPHSDVGTNAVAGQLGMERYVQLLLLMTKKGVDFHEGGAYIDIDGKRYFFESECEIGDIVIYDGRVNHGVEEIDPLEPLDLSSFAGRHVALVTLFKHFSKDASEDEYNALMKPASKTEPVSARSGGSIRRD